MDPLSALAATKHIAIQCADCILTLTKWINQVKVVDTRVNSFKEEILALQLTYEEISSGLKEPLVVEIARSTDRGASGRLWSQTCVVLGDCQITLLDIRQRLEKLGRGNKRVASIIKQLNESLYGGDLLRLSGRVQLFNTVLSFPLQMINITRQLQCQIPEPPNQKRILLEISSLNDATDALGERARHFIRMYGWSGSTLKGEVSHDGKVYQNMETLAMIAKGFLSNVSAIADLRSDARQSMLSGDGTLGSWMTYSSQSNQDCNEHPSQTKDLPPHKMAKLEDLAETEDLDPDIELELELTIEYLENGRSDAAQLDYKNAEANFRAALEVIEDNNFKNKSPCSAADVILLIADCCLKQEKYEDAIELLEPVAESAEASEQHESQIDDSNHTLPPRESNFDLDTALKASHIIALCFFLKHDYPNAEKRAKQAFKGRRKLLKPQHLLTQETVQLLIDIFKAKDDQVNARAYRRFLEPQSTTSEPKAHVQESRSNSVDIIQSPVETKLPVDVFESLSVKPDPLPPNIPAPNSRKKLSWSNPFSRMGKIDEFESLPRRGTLPFSSHTLYEHPSRNSSETFGLNSSTSSSIGNRRSHSLSVTLSTFSNSSRIPGSDEIVKSHSTHPSLASNNDIRSSGSQTRVRGYSRSEIAPEFQSIRSLRQEGKTKHSVEAALRFLREYDPERRTLIIREAELKKNMRESELGLASSGHGYAPIHFFCEQKIEATTEVELLLEGGVDVNAIAYKAGMPGTDPFSPLQRAIERGHVNITRMLINAKCSLAPPRIPKQYHLSPVDREALQPLLMACTRGHVEIVYLLLEAGATPEIREFPLRLWHGNSLLHEASWLCDLPMVKMLLDYQAEHQQQAGVTGAKILLGRGREWERTVGKPGQQDHFGATPLMYAIDLRDSPSDRMRAKKAAARTQCLRLLLEHDIHGERNTQSYRESVVQMLSLKWNRGPGNGHSIFCYADSTGDSELIELLDPFRYQCAPDERCTASPVRCSRKGNTLSAKVSELAPTFVELMAPVPEISSLGTGNNNTSMSASNEGGLSRSKQSDSTTSTLAESAKSDDKSIKSTASSIPIPGRTSSERFRAKYTSKDSEAEKRLFSKDSQISV